ncbi:MAG: hypothetical protein ACE5KY_06595 [Candidatus Tectimicrobiota bacterium]
MEGLLYLPPANFWAALTYACMVVYVLWFEAAIDKRTREPADTLHVVIDEAEITEFEKAA